MAEDSEHRIKARHPLDQEVMLSTDSTFRLCRVHDISETGALLSVAWFGLGKKTPVVLTMNLNTDGKKIDSYQLQAEVARVSNEGTAIMFTDLDSHTRTALIQFVDML